MLKFLLIFVKLFRYDYSYLHVDGLIKLIFLYFWRCKIVQKRTTKRIFFLNFALPRISY